MIVRPSSLTGLVLIEPRFFSDSRGGFYENWNDRGCREAGIERAPTFAAAIRGLTAP